MNKRAVFFTIDILVAIVIVFLFSIFFFSHLSAAENSFPLAQLQLQSTAQDFERIFQETESLALGIDGDTSQIVDTIQTLVPEQLCIQVQVYQGASQLFSVSKEGCVLLDEIVISKFPVYHENAEYLGEIGVWIQ